MSYITASQIYGKIPQARVNDALDDDGSGDAALIAAQLAQVISNACNAVDGALEGRYTVPFTGTIPQKVVDAALIFACEDIWGRRPIAEMRNPFTKRANEFRDQFALIAQRKMALDATNEPEVSGAKAGGNAAVPGRMSTLPTIGP